MRWISVEERLPKDLATVVVHFRGANDQWWWPAYREHGEWRWADSHWRVSPELQITHWLDLALPGSDEDGGDA